MTLRIRVEKGEVRKDEFSPGADEGDIVDYKRVKAAVHTRQSGHTDELEAIVDIRAKLFSIGPKKGTVPKVDVDAVGRGILNQIKSPSRACPAHCSKK